MAHERVRPKAPKTAKIVLWVVLILLYLPIAVMLLSSVFSVQGGHVQATLNWFIEVLSDSNLMSALGNSLLVGVSSSVLATVFGTAAAIALHRGSSKLKTVMDSLSMVSLIFPEIVFALSLLAWFFILQLDLGLQTVVIAHVSFSLSYVIMTVNSRLVTLDPALEDAARDLGAGEWTVLRTIIVPLLSPAILGGFILSFLLSFDDFLITYFVNGVGQDTLPVKLYTAMKMGVSPKLNALSSLMFLMTLSVLIFLFRSSAFRVLFEGSTEGRDLDGRQEKENL